MNGARDENKVMGPLFPRLHVSDTEKGGPRAPPRNKMALYEQLSIPSQRFNCRSHSMLPLPQNNGGNLAPSVSSSHGDGPERSVFPQICNSIGPAHSTEGLYSYCSKDNMLNATLGNLERKSMKLINRQTSNSTVQLSSTATSNSYQPLDFSSFESSYLKKLGEEIDIRLPTIVKSGMAPRTTNSQLSMNRQKVPLLSSSMQLQAAHEKLFTRTGTIDAKSGQNVRNQREKTPAVSQTSQDLAGRPSSVSLVREKTSKHASLSPDTRDKLSDQSKPAQAPINQQSRNSSLNGSIRVCGIDAQSHKESRATEEVAALSKGVPGEPTEGVDNDNASMLGGEFCSRPSIEDGRRSPKELEYDIEGCKEMDSGRDVDSGPLKIEDLDTNNDVSDTSMVDSVSCVDLSPDDIIGIIGEKQFWRARRAIVNQQRVFSVQVFELHRLIKVQRMIAGSPHLLLEGNLYLGQPLLKVSALKKKLPSEYVLEPQPLAVRSKHDSQKPNSTTKCAANNSVEKPPPPFNQEASRAPVPLLLNNVPYLESLPRTPVTTDTKLAPLYFRPPPGNQWLVPVMSPSEGLVYKPCTVPSPPPAGFVAPIYGSCAPMNASPWGGDKYNTSCGGFGILPSNLLDQSHFPPNGTAVISQSFSSSSVEQMGSYTGAGSNGQNKRLRSRDAGFSIPFQSSCNVSGEANGGVSHHVDKAHPSRDSDELQRSSASSPSERAQRDALALFPMAPKSLVSDSPGQTHSRQQQTRVIKVVPHNPRSATESAARIFQSIQEERKQQD